MSQNNHPADTEAGAESESESGQVSEQVNDTEDPSGVQARPADTRSEPRAYETDDGNGADDTALTDATDAELSGPYTDSLPADDPDARFEALWERLNDNQRRYVLARQTHRHKAYAAEHVGLHRDTAYKWPAYVEEAVDLMQTLQKDSIKQGLASMSHKAIVQLERLLESEDPKTQLKAVQEVLNRLKGKPIQRQEVEHSGGVDVGGADLDGALAQLTDRAARLGAEGE
jgi:hypothetical protein